MVSVLRAVLGDHRSWAGCRERETPGWAAYSTLSIYVTSVWRCLQIQAIRGRGPGSFQSGLEDTMALATGRPDPSGGVILVTTVCLSH